METMGPEAAILRTRLPRENGFDNYSRLEFPRESQAYIATSTRKALAELGNSRRISAEQDDPVSVGLAEFMGVPTPPPTGWTRLRRALGIGGGRPAHAAVEVKLAEVLSGPALGLMVREEVPAALGMVDRSAESRPSGQSMVALPLYRTPQR